VTVGSLVTFILAALPDALREGARNLTQAGAADVTGSGPGGFFYAVALMFVAFAGYARVATLGEEVRDPRRNIPRAIIILLIVTALLYIAVAAVAVSAAGIEALSEATSLRGTPLEAAARALGTPGINVIIAVGAVTATLGVLLNLILGLSRVVLAMGRQGDLPPLFARLSRQATTPSAAVVGVGLVIAALALTGSVETTWAFSAFSILVYYGITNLAALRLPNENRLYPRYIAWAGLAACLFLAFWVPPHIWLIGLGLIAIGLAWHFAVPRLWRGRA
jgi:APA family basic amino acid/polyamine antiporter